MTVLAQLVTSPGFRYIIHAVRQLESATVEQMIAGGEDRNLAAASIYGMRSAESIVVNELHRLTEEKRRKELEELP